MSNHQEPPGIEVELTGNLRSDIVLLSSLLDGQQANRPSAPHDPQNKGLLLLSHISTALTLGSDDSPVATLVHAISGKMSEDAVEFVVCAQNTSQEVRPTGDTSPPLEPPSGRNTPVRNATDASKGAQLLQSWSTDETRNFDLKDHLRDVFQILTYLSSRPLNDPGFAAFDHLLHRRAFRKLGWRIQEFFKNWGQPPFRVFLGSLPDEVEASPKYSLSFTVGEYSVLQVYEFPFVEDDFPANARRVEREVYVDSRNVKKWLVAFDNQLHGLRECFPCPSPSSPPGSYPLPTVNNVKFGVASLQCLSIIKPVLMHILSAKWVEDALANIEHDIRQAQIASLSSSVPKGHLGYFKFPSLDHDAKEEGQVEGRQGDGNGGGEGERDEGENGKDEGEEENADTISRASTPEALDLPKTSALDSAPVKRFMRLLRSITAWKAAVNALSSNARKFGGQEMKIQFLSCELLIPQQKYNADLKAKLANLFPGLALEHKDQRPFGLMLKDWSNAKLHAEAMLMGWIFENSTKEIFSSEVPIAVSKKCCFLCWSLHEKLNKLGTIRLTLPGTHSGIFGWIPPRGIPDDILRELRKDLLLIVRDYSFIRSRQSSLDSNATQAYERPQENEKDLVAISREKQAKARDVDKGI